MRNNKGSYHSKLLKVWCRMLYFTVLALFEKLLIYYTFEMCTRVEPLHLYLLIQAESMLDFQREFNNRAALGVENLVSKSHQNNTKNKQSILI